MYSYSGKEQVVLGLENHWGLGLTSKGVMKIVNAINSPWLSVTLDTGNFFDNREEQIKDLAPHTCLIQQKRILEVLSGLHLMK